MNIENSNINCFTSVWPHKVGYPQPLNLTPLAKKLV